MRRVNDILAIAMILALVAWTFVHFSDDDVVQTPSAEAAQVALRILEREIKLQATLEEGRSRGYPAMVDPKWFHPRPINPLLTAAHPWLEIAHPSQRHATDPPDIVAISSAVASFWYNPATGAIRARVPDTGNQHETLALYNRVNGTHLRPQYASVPDFE